MKPFPLFGLLLLLCAAVSVPAPQAERAPGALCLAPRLSAAGSDADLFVQRSLALYPDVLDEARFVPARYAHIRSVIKTYYLFVNGRFDELYDYLPEAERQNTTREEYRALLGKVLALYLTLAPETRAELETAVILHDIGYPGGVEREHPRRGSELAARILPPESRQSIPLLIDVHGIDMGVERLPEEFHSIAALTEENKTQLFFMALFDNMGKVKGAPGAFTINNLMPPQYIRFFGSMLLCVLRDKTNPALLGFADTSIDLVSDFYLFRLRSCFGYMVYAMLDEADYALIRASADRLLGTDTQEREIFNRAWSHTIKINTFSVFLNLKRLNRPDGFDLIIRLTRNIAHLADGRDGLVVFRTDVDYLSMDVQRQYREELNYLASLLAADAPLPLVYDPVERAVILRFEELRRALDSDRAQRLNRAA